MLIGRKFIPTPFRSDGRKSKHKIKRMFILECDQCKIIFDFPDPYVLKREFNFCCLDCLNKSQCTGGLISKKKKDIFVKRYGVENPFQATEVKNTIKSNFLEKFGVEYVSQLQTTKQQIKNTCLERYGVSSVLQIPEIHKKGIESANSIEAREKASITCFEHYGVTHPLKSKEVRDKIRLTNLERYGAENVFASEQIKDKIKQTNIKMYGVEYASQFEEFKVKMRATNLERYGAENPAQNKDIFRKMQMSRRAFSIVKHWKTNEELTCVGSYEVAFVNWCNINRIDFDWQIPHKMPDGRVYNVDAFIKNGKFADTWIEIKGWFPENRRDKWEWFHSEYPNDSQIWFLETLKALGVL